MKVKLIEDLDDELWQGTVLQDVVENSRDPSMYDGLFCSRAGSYVITVPKSACTVHDEAEQQQKLNAFIRQLNAKIIEHTTTPT